KRDRHQRPADERKHDADLGGEGGDRLPADGALDDVRRDGQACRQHRDPHGLEDRKPGLRREQQDEGERDERRERDAASILDGRPREPGGLRPPPGGHRCGVCLCSAHGWLAVRWVVVDPARTGTYATGWACGAGASAQGLPVRDAVRRGRTSVAPLPKSTMPIVSTRILMSSSTDRFLM